MIPKEIMEVTTALYDMATFQVGLSEYSWVSLYY